MNRDYCIFDNKKPCNNCGDCDACDLDPNKKCNNCGKCLEMEGYDMKAIKIEDIIEDKNEAKDYEAQHELKNEHGDTLDESHYHLEHKSSEIENEDIFDKGCVEYIDDIDGLNDMLKSEKDFNKLAQEDYPGFIRINTGNKNQSHK